MFPWKTTFFAVGAAGAVTFGQRPSLAARIPPRLDQERKALTTVTPRPPLTDAPTPDLRAKTSARKRKPIPVAEGQLGFDFYDNRL